MARRTRRKSVRRSKRSTRGKRSTLGKRNGGGYSFDPSNSVSIGNLTTMRYDGVGKDCMGGSFVRPGFMSSYGENGVPGMQKGGRYELNPGAFLDGSDIGMKSYSGAARIACEGGSANSLNMRGGAADSMQVTAQTAGYGHGFETLGNAGGLLINTPYRAGAFSPACTKTGGKRRKHRKHSTRSKRHSKRRN